MFDVLKTLSGIVTPKKSGATHKAKPATQPAVQKQAVPAPKPVVQPVALVAPVVPTVDMAAVAAARAELLEAQAKAREVVFDAKDEAHKIRRQAEDEVRKLVEEARRTLEGVERREGSLEEREKRARQIEEQIEKNRVEIEKAKAEAVTKLQKVAHLSEVDAKNQLLSELQEKLKEDMAKVIVDATAKAKEEADLKAREILVDAMRHGSTDYVAEYTVSVVKLTDDDMKGRIIGKEGRNIRAFETATGVDVDLDQEGVIRLSCFDPVRREIARVSLERLMRDGRVQPGRIEEIIEQVKKELERIMFEEGQKLCHAVGVYNLPAPLVALLGKFKYRYSYGQNMIAHTLEETKIGIAIAHEVGADVNIVRLGCLLHDIGKVIMDKEGSHVDLGVEILKKYGLPTKVVDCVAQHHEDKAFSSLESVLVYIADAISGGRPGARYENYDEYVKRLTDLEGIAKAKKGVKETFAFQAGRELRVLVDPGQVDDATSTLMAREIKEEIEQKLTYPGQIKVIVIRELRTTETAK